MRQRLRKFREMEAIKRLAGGVSHDLNNVLTVMTAYSDFLMLGGSGKS